jgi:hypothetical protein
MALVALNLRQLWLSFRFLALTGTLAALGLAVPFAAVQLPPLISPGVVSSPTVDLLTWYGRALGAAALLFAATAAATLVEERQRGTMGWVLTAPVARGSLYVAWLLAFTVTALPALTASAAIAWLAAGAFGAALDPVEFLAAAASAGMFVAAGAAVGLASGAAIARGARLAALAGTLGLLLVPAVVPPGALPWLPAGGVVVFAELALGRRPAVEALQVAGVVMVVLALLASVGSLALARADL